MSTRYYAVGSTHRGACEHCAQEGEQVLICSTFRLFRAYPRDEEFGGGDPITHQDIRSWDDWKKMLQSPKVAYVITEYGKAWSAALFIREVEQLPTSHWDRIAAECSPDWCDSRGIPFSTSVC